MTSWPDPADGLVIIGAGGAAREVYWYACAIGVERICFVDDVSGISELVLNGKSIPVVSDWSAFKGTLGATFRRFVSPLGDTAVKRTLVGRAEQAGLRPSRALVHPSAIITGDDTVIGDGSVISPGAVITTGVRLGRHVYVNYNATIGHDTEVGDFCTLNPGSNISGNVTLGRGVLVGAGATIREKVRVADDCTIGIQSAIVKHVSEPGSVIVGVPGRPLR